MAEHPRCTLTAHSLDHSPTHVLTHSLTHWAAEAAAADTLAAFRACYNQLGVVPLGKGRGIDFSRSRADNINDEWVLAVRAQGAVLAQILIAQGGDSAENLKALVLTGGGRGPFQVKVTSLLRGNMEPRIGYDAVKQHHMLLKFSVLVAGNLFAVPNTTQ
jgi:hypothetical protein